MNPHSVVRLCRGIIAAHAVLTVLDNLPDGKISLGVELPFIGRLPQWRFFAPNPGVEDLHVMFRHRSGDDQPWAQWLEYPTAVEPSQLAFLWNPRSRRPKALFDIINQLRVMSSYPWAFPVAVRSPGFHLICIEVGRHCRQAFPSAAEFQFMALVSRPGEGRDGLRPIMVSPATPLSRDEGVSIAG